MLANLIRASSRNMTSERRIFITQPPISISKADPRIKMSRSPTPSSSQGHARQDSSSLSPFDQSDHPYSPDPALRPTVSTRSTVYSPLGIMLEDDVQTARDGSYTALNRPVSRLEIEEADGESLLSHRRTGSKSSVVHYDRMDSWNSVVKTGTNKLFLTIFFGGVLCLCLRSWEGFGKPIPLDDWDVRVFNGLTIAISICLGLNLLASLKRYAVILRWSILTKTYVSMEVFDLILGIDELTNVTKLLAMSIPGLRRQKWLLRSSYLRKGTRSGMNAWYPFVCCIWLLLNIGSQVLVASLSLFWPMKPFQCELGTYGNVSLADLTQWNTTGDSRNAKEAAWRYGMDAQSWDPIDITDTLAPIQDLSAFPGTPILRGNSFYEYRFYYRNPEHPYDDYSLSNRSVQVRATCDQLVTDGEIRGTGLDTHVVVIDQGQPRNVSIPGYGEGSIVYIAHLEEEGDCEPRCNRITVLQLKNDFTINATSLWECKNQVDEVVQKDDKRMAGKSINETLLKGTDEFATIAAGAVAWTGFIQNRWKDRQWRVYPRGTRWSPDHKASTADVADVIMRHTIGAIAAFDDHGNNFTININNHTCDKLNQRLEVRWLWIGVILGAIALIQLTALWYLLSYADRSIVRDASYFSTAMLLKPVLKELDGELGVMAMSGAQIKNHEKLQGRRIKYDYKGDRYDLVREVTISFEDEIGQPKKQGRPKKQIWPSGSYT